MDSTIQASATAGRDGTVSRNEGCHKCKKKPVPGSDYIGSPCEKCKYADSRFIGHGRVVSYDELAPMLGAQDNGRIVFAGEEIASEDSSPEAELFAIAGEDGNRRICPHLDQFLSLFGGFLSELAQLNTTGLVAIFGTMRGRRLEDMAKELGCTPQNISLRLRYAAKQMPLLGVLFPRVGASGNKALKK